MPLWPRSPTSSWSSLRTATPSQHTPGDDEGDEEEDPGDEGNEGEEDEGNEEGEEDKGGKAPDQFGISPFDTTKDTTSPSVTTSRSTILLAVTVPLGAIVFVAAAIFTLRKVLRKSTQTIPGHTPPQEEVHHGSARQTQIYPDSPSPDEVERR
eukprot:CAMPEP_0184674562 /NCGR_PEP_ID=MMETSP0308-20130426/87308_1 /TAXON_ID=38269 /ORGANISM="Gloeochaete witrockiana, Strain SAG 46.84" /LENGTH=152 /DNA_ID=CAMNT_0027122181 /DNA_START=641 /DNA_END=1099 /DNA_ORIENTATION=-